MAGSSVYFRFRQVFNAVLLLRSFFRFFNRILHMLRMLRRPRSIHSSTVNRSNPIAVGFLLEAPINRGKAKGLGTGRMKEPRRQPTPTTTTLLTTGIAIALVGHSRGNRESGDGLRTMRRTLNGQYGCSNSSVELPKVFRSLPYRKAFM